MATANAGADTPGFRQRNSSYARDRKSCAVTESSSKSTGEGHEGTQEQPLDAPGDRQNIKNNQLYNKLNSL